MPHATNDMSSQPMTNGEQPSSKVISRVTSYPIVNDSIETFKQNPYGKKSLEIADGAYQKFAKPVEPYLQTPYSYAKPYVNKADEMADSGLGSVESRFPIVKEDTQTVVESAKSYAWWPYSYLVNTYSDEYKKTAQHNNRGRGLTTSGMALISTQLKMTSDFFQMLADFLGPKYDESKKKGADYVRHAQDTAEQYKQAGQDKAGTYLQYGQQKADELSKQGQQKTDELSEEGQQKLNEYQKLGQEKSEQAKGQVQETKEQAKGAAQQTKEDAQKKTQSK